MTAEQQLDLDAIEARHTAATAGPWEDADATDSFTTVIRAGSGALACVSSPADAKFIAHARTDVPALLAEVRRLRADVAAELLPAWEAMYEPGNVSDYLIGYANSEAGARGAAEAWLRSQKDEPGRLEWVPQTPLDGYDTEAELVERHDDGIDTGPGITVRHRAPAPEETAGRPETADDGRCPACGHTVCDGDGPCGGRSGNDFCTCPGAAVVSAEAQR